MRRPAAVFALAVITVAAVAMPAAGQRVGQVEGGGSFNDAPIVAPGRYTDTIRPKERLFYAIEVQPGQKLKARAVIEGTLSTDDSPIRSEMKMHNPTRDEIPGQLAIHQVWSRDSTLRLAGDKVGEGEQFFSDPGLYYVAIALGQGRRSQFDVDLKFTLKGTPVEPDPTPTEGPSPTGEETPAEEPTEDPTPEETQQPPAGSGSASPPTGGDDEFPVGLFVGFFVAGALGGSAVELFRGARARA
jgi:hypothetical protein